MVEWYLQAKPKNLGWGGNLSQCPAQIPQGLTCVHTQTSIMRGRWHRLSHDMALILELQLLACLSAVVTASQIELVIVTVPRHISTTCLGLLIINLPCSTCLLSYTEFFLFKTKNFLFWKVWFLLTKSSPVTATLQRDSIFLQSRCSFTLLGCMYKQKR